MGGSSQPQIPQSNQQQPGTVPLANTGVPAQQQLPSSTPQSSDLLSTLTALGGLGLNIGSMFANRGGAAGNGALEWAQQHQQQANQQQKDAQDKAQQVADDAADEKADSDLAAKYQPLVDRIKDQAKQGVAQEMLDQGRPSDLESYLNKLQSQDMEQKHLALAQQSHADAMANFQAGAYDAAAKSYGKTADTLGKAVNPEVAKNLQIAQNLIPNLSTQDLQNAGNFAVRVKELQSKGGFDSKLNKQDIENLRQTLLTAAAPQGQSTLLSSIGLTSPTLPDKLNPQALANTFLANRGITGEDTAKYTNTQKAISEAQAAQQEAAQAAQNVRLKAAGGSVQAKLKAPAPASTSAAVPQGQRLYSKSTGKYYVRQADGSLTEVK